MSVKRMQVQICAVRGATLLFSLAMGLVFTQYAHPQTPGTWNPSGAMSAVRETPTAVLLNDGTVLVVGGGSSAFSDVYDPRSNTWTMVGSMSTGRNYEAGTILADGRVLVAGGQNPDQMVLASAEVYDPATQTWTQTGSMNSARYMHSATLLPNGKVLVAGGWPGPGPCCPVPEDALTSSELWDPVTGTWATTSDMPSPSADHTATLLSDGTVLIAGGESYGQGSGTLVVASAAIYDGSDETWTTVSDMSTPRDHAAAALLSDGRVLLAGGSPGGCCSGQSSAELFDPNTLAWTSVPDMTTGRNGPAASAIFSGGAILVSGGYSCCSDPIPTRVSSEIFDSANGTWHLTGSLSQARAYHTSVTLLDGTVLAVGGGLASAERYYPDPDINETIPSR